MARQSKQDLFKAVFELPQLTDSLYDLLGKKGTMTGSRVYGVGKATMDAARDEDWAIYISPEAFNGYTLSASKQKSGYNRRNESMSVIYGHRNGILINIMCFSDEHMFDAWRLTTMVMTVIADMTDRNYSYLNKKDRDMLREMLEEKWGRVNIFRALREGLYVAEKRTKPYDVLYAWRYRSCVECHGPATNFTCAQAYNNWQRDGRCERCNPLEL